MAAAYAALRDALSAQEPARALECLADARRLVDGATVLLVAELRRRRWSWQDIAGVLDVSRQSAHERYARAVRALEGDARGISAGADRTGDQGAAAHDVGEAPGETPEDTAAGELATAAPAAAPAGAERQDLAETSTSTGVGEEIVCAYCGQPKAAPVTASCPARSGWVDRAGQVRTEHRWDDGSNDAPAPEQAPAPVGENERLDSGQDTAETSPARPSQRQRRRRRQAPAATPAPEGKDAAPAAASGNPWDPYELVKSSQQGNWLVTYQGETVAMLRSELSATGRSKRWVPCTPSGVRIGTRAYSRRLDAVVQAVGDHHAKHIAPKPKRRR